MSRRLPIRRRDFLGGIALATTAGALSPLEALARATAGSAAAPPYPPALTGLRGSTAQSYEVAHALAWSGQRFAMPGQQTDDDYDLVVVGGGISGLAAAFLWRQAKGADARILILDNHDDFGGHARRNEFTIDGQSLLCYGGSQSLEAPGSYSPAASRLIRDLGIHTERFYEYYDQEYFARKGLGVGVHFPAAHYGRDHTLPWAMDDWGGDFDGDLAATVARYPLDSAAQQALIELLSDSGNHLPHLAPLARADWLRRRSYRDYLLETLDVPEAVYLLLRDTYRGIWGVGWDALSALEAVRAGMPGTYNLQLPRAEVDDGDSEEPYIFHFPDGNAAVARAMVRQLIPAAVPGDTMEDLVGARTDYAQLDRAGAACRLRLNSTVVRVQHDAGQRWVDIAYARDGEVHRVRGRHVIMACYNAMLPHLCPELPEEQREALAYATKVPLVYVSMAVRNWKPFAELGMHSIRVVQPDFMHSFGMDFPVSMGGIRYTESPMQPAVLHGSVTPCLPDSGLSAREQCIRGRQRLYEMTWDEMESLIISQLEGALGGAGFDVERDLAAITANRWPHGYAWEYNDLYDPPEYGPDNGPHLLGARQIGRISIANSDASAYAYVDGAIDAAFRATREQLG